MNSQFERTIQQASQGLQQYLQESQSLPRPEALALQIAGVMKCNGILAEIDLPYALLPTVVFSGLLSAQQALFIVARLPGEAEKAGALKLLAPHLPALALPQALGLAAQIAITRDRARALAALLPHLSPSDTRQALDEALQCLKIEEEGGKLWIEGRGWVLPYLDAATQQVFLTEIIQQCSKMSSYTDCFGPKENQRFGALEELFRCLPVDQRAHIARAMLPLAQKAQPIDYRMELLTALASNLASTEAQEILLQTTKTASALHFRWGYGFPDLLYKRLDAAQDNTLEQLMQSTQKTKFRDIDPSTLRSARIYELPANQQPQAARQLLAEILADQIFNPRLAAELSNIVALLPGSASPEFVDAALKCPDFDYPFVLEILAQSLDAEQQKVLLQILISKAQHISKLGMDLIFTRPVFQNLLLQIQRKTLLALFAIMKPQATSQAVVSYARIANVLELYTGESNTTNSSSPSDQPRTVGSPDFKAQVQAVLHAPPVCRIDTARMDRLRQKQRYYPIHECHAHVVELLTDDLSPSQKIDACRQALHELGLLRYELQYTNENDLWLETFHTIAIQLPGELQAEAAAFVRRLPHYLDSKQWDTPNHRAQAMGCLFNHLSPENQAPIMRQVLLEGGFQGIDLLPLLPGLMRWAAAHPQPAYALWLDVLPGLAEVHPKLMGTSLACLLPFALASGDARQTAQAVLAQLK